MEITKMSYYERAEKLCATIKAALGDCPEATAQLESEEEITLVHEAWKNFARDNGCEEKDFEIGWSYLQVCGDRLPTTASAVADSGPSAEPSYLKPLPDEQLDLVYPRELKGQQRWFRLRVAAGNDGKRRSIVIQTDINPSAPGKLSSSRVKSSKVRSA
jgi:hypothetical protein